LPAGDRFPNDTTVKITDTVLPNHADGREISNYTISASGSPTTTTTLAFLGLVDGVMSELDMAAAGQLFLHDAVRWLVPFLRATDDTTDLFVGVDLTQFLAMPVPYQVGDVFSFTNGLSQSLPGIVVGTSPVFFDGAGFTSMDLYDGDAGVVAEIDGETTPEPTTPALFAIGAASLAVTGRRRAKQWVSY
jgi:hypothetical protein